MSGRDKLNPNDERKKVARRSFLRSSAFAAGGAAASGVIRMPSFARVLSAESPVASTRFGKVRGYVDNGINVFKGIRYGADTTSRRFLPPGATAIGPTAQRMADQMSETFIAFARTGNPNNQQIPRWEPYTLPRRRTMVFDTPSHLEDDPRGAERRLFAKVPYVQPGT